MLYYYGIDVSEGIDINKHVHRKNVIFVTMGIFQTKDSCFNHMYATEVKI